MGATIQSASPATARAASQGMPSDALVCFGATGDLAYEKIFPALQYGLSRTGDLSHRPLPRQRVGCPVKLINDAAMQALGSYNGGLLLFLGLGTGLGSAMVVDNIVQPMELGHLPYKNGRTYEDHVGLCGLKRLGKKRWRRHVAAVVGLLKAALEPDDVVIGGGNAKKLAELPPGIRLGDNANAFVGGSKLWKEHAT